MMAFVSEWYKQVMQWGQMYRQPGIFKLWLLSKPVIGVTRAETAEVNTFSETVINSITFIYIYRGSVPETAK